MQMIEKHGKQIAICATDYEAHEQMSKGIAAFSLRELEVLRKTFKVVDLETFKAIWAAKKELLGRIV